MNGLNILLRIFFGVAVLVHIVGLFEHVSDESVLSHITHIISYGICCLLTGKVKNQVQLAFLVAGGIYPFGYHLNCFVNQALAGKFSVICLLVVLAIPAAIFTGFKQTRASSV